MEQDQHDEFKANEKALKAHEFDRKRTFEAMIDDLDKMVSYYERKIDQYRNEIEKYKAQRNMLASVIGV